MNRIQETKKYGPERDVLANALEGAAAMWVRPTSDDPTVKRLYAVLRVLSLGTLGLAIWSAVQKRRADAEQSTL